MASPVCTQGASLIPKPVSPHKTTCLQVCFSAVVSLPPLCLHLCLYRLPLPEPWRGLRDEALDEVSGIPGCIFVHASGFIGGHRTREGALNMARATLAQHPAPTPLENAVVK